MEQAIKKAIEGGYNPCILNWEMMYAWADYVSDPLFWQSLGKQQCWNEKKTHDRQVFGPDIHIVDVTGPEWLIHWHFFINHIAEDGDIDEFFNQLIK